MPATVVHATSRTHRLRWPGLVVLALGLFMASLDNTILNVALPTLARELQASTGQLQWMVDSYQLTYAGLLLVAGGLVDRWGQSRTFLVGSLVFGSFSLLAGLVSQIGWLIGARALMGIGAALLAPSTLTLISTLFADRKERTIAFAVWSAANGAGGAVGPVLSGILLEHFSWGSIFLINVPIAAGIIIVGSAVLPHSRSQPSQHGIDYQGALLSTAALVMICWAVISAPGLVVLNPVILAAAGVGIGLLAFFLYWESRVQVPLLQLSLFKSRKFSVSVGVAGLVTAAGAGALFVLTQYLQFTLSYSPIETGLRVLPVAAAMLIGALSAPRAIVHIHIKWAVVTGLALVGIGYLWLATTTENSSFGHLLPGLILFGLGAGLLVPAATQAVMDALPREFAGAGSATNTALMQVGSALGVAIIGALLSARYQTVLISSSVWDQLGHWQSSALESVAGSMRAAEHFPPDLANQIVLLGNHAFVSGMQLSLAICAVAIILAVVLVIVLYPGEKNM